MPELPEVETATLLLRKKVLNKTFVSYWAENKNVGLEKIIGKKIKKIERRGKGIFFQLNDKSVTFIHLRMTGHLLFGEWTLKKDNKKEEWISEDKIMQERKNGFLRYVFLFKEGGQLALSDQRKFAKVLVFSPKEAENYKKSIGPEPLLLTKEEFVNLFKGRKTKIKPLLMDQSFIAGIGNIYAAEILFKAKISPEKRASDLKEDEIEKIYFFMNKILKKAILLKGDSTSDYRLLSGKKGSYQEHHLVYNRKEEKCIECSEKIRRTVVGGRGTYYCPKCQK